MRAISNHQIGVYQECPQKWNYAYVDLWVPRRTEAYLNRGTMIHKVLEIHYRDGVEAANKYLAGELAIPANITRLKILKDVLRTYQMYVPWAREKDKFWKIEAVEFEFIFPSVTPAGRPFAWRGVIDLVYTDRITGELIIVDHKSSDGKPRSIRKTRLDPQLPIYAKAIQELGLWGGKVKGLTYNFLNTHEYAEKTLRTMTVDDFLQRRTSYIEEREIDFLMTELGRSVDELHQDSLNDRMNIDGARCGRCRYQTICEMRMKGIDPTPLLVNNFDRRLPAEVDIDEKEQ